jgi:hypothetical protein
MLKKVLLVSVGLASLILPPVASAEVSYTPPSGNKMATIVVSGEIRQEDLQHFLAFTRLARGSHSSGFYSVDLDSIGGDVETALDMGWILRGDKAFVGVRDNAKCFSSCVFVLAGAKSRYVTGAVGIHRPYWLADNATTAIAQKEQYERFEKKIKAFLQLVNVLKTCTTI